MPLYTYECKECNITVERLRSLNDSTVPVYCEKCNKEMQKVFNPANTSFELKGKGWFKTDGKY